MNLLARRIQAMNAWILDLKDVVLVSMPFLLFQSYGSARWDAVAWCINLVFDMDNQHLSHVFQWGWKNCAVHWWWIFVVLFGDYFRCQLSMWGRRFTAKIFIGRYDIDGIFSTDFFPLISRFSSSCPSQLSDARFFFILLHRLILSSRPFTFVPLALCRFPRFTDGYKLRILWSDRIWLILQQSHRIDRFHRWLMTFSTWSFVP